MPSEQLKRAAQYVRMSTDMQKYSTENQKTLIALYAAREGFEIVKTYADEGKSGLSIKGRVGLQQLLQDVRDGNADFGTVLVYDVSRWGVSKMLMKAPITNFYAERPASRCGTAPKNSLMTAASLQPLSKA
jgi:DNA invertase Pin-like site-specific DNA recombinase